MAPARSRRRSAEDELFGPEYAVVRLRASWTSLAYLCVVLSMSAGHWLRLIPFELRWRRPFVMVAAVLGLSLLGSLAAWRGHRLDASSINKVALLCNVVAFGLSLLAALVVAIILPNY